MAKNPDECTRNIVRASAVIFLLYSITLLYSYRIVPLNWAIWVLFGFGFLAVVLIFVYFNKYHSFKKSNIVPLKNTLRDLKELKAQFEKTKNEKMEEEMKKYWEKSVKQMSAFLESERQYIRVITRNYEGIIGMVEKHDKVNHIYFTDAKGVEIIRSDVSMDLTTIEYIEGIPDIREYHKEYSRKKPQESGLKELFKKL